MRAARVRALALAALAAAALPGARAARAQTGGEALSGAGVFVNDEVEGYLRVLQVGGLAPLYPWSARAFSPAEVERLLPADSVAHPWAGRAELRRDSVSGARFHVLPARARVIYNSAFPYGVNDGAVWAGRGVTSVLEGGVAYRRGRFSVTVAPLLFRAENADFDLMPNGQTGRMEYADGQNPTTIDQPQRFGDAAYTRLDPGQSTVRLDLSSVSVGLSTANQQWGPAVIYPLILGNNAAGFPHAFVATPRPVDLRYVRLHGRALWGVLDQSDFFEIAGYPRRRFATGLVAVLSPAGAPELELGVATFNHMAWPADGLSARDLLSIPREFAPEDSLASWAGNRLASVFARWVLPRAGVEVYGEFGREDRSGGLRDLLLEPDHTSAYALGMRKVWRLAPRSVRAFRAELLNAQASQLSRTRGGGRFYAHVGTWQGHTHLGQILAASAGYGGGGVAVALDTYSARGRWSLAWSRELRGERGNLPSTGREEPDGLDVLHSIGLEGVLLRGRWEVTGGLTAAYNLNRNFSADVGSWGTRLGLRWSR